MLFKEMSVVNTAFCTNVSIPNKVLEVYVFLKLYSGVELFAVSNGSKWLDVLSESNLLVWMSSPTINLQASQWARLGKGNRFPSAHLSFYLHKRSLPWRGKRALSRHQRNYHRSQLLIQGRKKQAADACLSGDQLCQMVSGVAACTIKPQLCHWNYIQFGNPALTSSFTTSVQHS